MKSLGLFSQGNDTVPKSNNFETSRKRKRDSLEGSIIYFLYIFIKFNLCVLFSEIVCDIGDQQVFNNDARNCNPTLPGNNYFLV